MSVSVLYWSGAARLYERLVPQDGAVVLMYHSIADGDAADFVDPPNRLAPALFERQMAFLAKHRSVVPLSAIVERMAAGAAPPAGAVSITFDDGYLDNLTVAAPILDRYKLPATLFLATGYVQRAESQWADQLHWMTLRRTKHRVAVPALGDAAFDLSTSRGRSAFRRAAHRRLLAAAYPERRRLLDEIMIQVAPEGTPPRLTMNWNDVREMRKNHPGIEIGGHTRDHIDLRSHGGEAASAQIAGCRDDIERELGFCPRYFSFPYGRWSTASRDMVRESGWHSAVGESGQARISRDSDRYVLGRVNAPVSMTDLMFKTGRAHPFEVSRLLSSKGASSG